MTSIHALLQQRYGKSQQLPDSLQYSPFAESTNPVLKTILAHSSLRHFSREKISPEVISLLIAAAQSASTSSNLQAWSVVAVQDSERKAVLSQLAGNQAFVREAPLFLVWTIDVHRSAQVITLAEIENGLEQAVGLESVDSLLIGTIDAALAAQNLTIAAHSLGLGSVYVGAIRNNLQGVIDQLKLPKGVIPVFGLAVGYPQNQVAQGIKPRLPQQVVLHHEVYQENHELNEQLLRDYESNLNLFQAQVGQTQDRWRDKVTQRLSALNGREHLAEVFNQHGLNLFVE
ncbi:nitroreductase family protein [Acinetobacter baumannii]